MSKPRKKQSSRTDTNQKNQYPYILGTPLRLVKTQDLAAVEKRLSNHPDKLLFGGRRANDRFMGGLYTYWKSLSPRQQDVLVRVCEGLSNAEIARQLNVTVPTVKSYLQDVFNKTQVRNRRQLMVRFARFDFPDRDTPTDWEEEFF